MEDMKQEVGDSDPDLLNLIENPVNKWGAQRLRSAEDMWASMLYRPEPFEVPESLRTFINRQYFGNRDGEPVMIKFDLDSDGQNEYLLFVLHEFGVSFSQFYYLEDDGWKGGALNHPGWRYGDETVLEMVKSGDIEIVEPRFKHLKIGEMLVQPSTSN
jgi:hypothetical protein